MGFLETPMTNQPSLQTILESSAQTPCLSLPLLAAAQAQKHVTLNEALWPAAGFVDRQLS